MNEIAREWLSIAEADMGTATRELEVDGVPNPRAAAFHAQQAAEKALKALLIQVRVESPRTHSLEPLLDLLPPPPLPELVAMRSDLRLLSRFAVRARYPGHDVAADEASQAVAIAATVLQSVHSALAKL
ncbi:MAG: HEPN domain-containing protein [Armatimonadia bacterium]|nr:HEPN domain-containing protein [Armatimonadia bacterium]